MIPLEEGEKLLMVAKKHWITYLLIFMVHVVLFVVFSIGVLFITTPIAREITISFLWLIATSYMWFFITQYLDRWYITNQRVIAIDQLELFDRTESNVLMSRVQDVQFKRSGILEELFGYGTLAVQSAGEEREFVIKEVANVESVAQVIIDQKAQKVQPLSVSQNPL